MEGLGTSILDAQSIGLPVVACNTGGIPEAVQHEVNGLLVPPKNEHKLAQSIKMLINNKVKSKEFGKNGKESVKKFAIENTILKNLKLYMDILI